MSRPKPQESPQNQKSAGSLGDLRNRSTFFSNQSHDKAVAEISMRDFLDFLKISYQVNEAIDNPSLDFTEKGSVDWKKLTSEALISRLKEREALLNKQKVENNNLKCQEKSDDPSCSETVTKKTECQTTKSTTRLCSEEKLPGKKLSFEKVTNNWSNVSSSASSLDRKITPEKIISGKKKGHCFKKEGSTESETSWCLDRPEEQAPVKLLKKKLNEVLQEGILDSVLPYLLPKHQHSSQGMTQVIAKKPSACEVKKSVVGNSEKSEKTSVEFTAKEKVEWRKKCFNNETSDKKDAEVVIHVCDEIKNLKKDFRCSQKILLSQMGYFAEVTAGQKLEDMDISVHCDVVIFDWLIKWVQKDNLSEEHWPVLGKKATEADKEICEVYGIDKTLVFKKFHSGDFLLKRDQRSGRPSEVDDDKMRAKIESNQHITVREVAKQLYVLNTTVENHIRRLGLVKKLVIWIPCFELSLAMRNESSIITIFGKDHNSKRKPYRKLNCIKKRSCSQFDPTIAVPILMSSAFLQINSLHEYCLKYCQKHINDIVRDSSNLSCLNDNVLTRLANLFSNVEIENIMDKKDKIQSKLYCKFIAALTEPEPQPSRGHYSSLATIYRCSRCLKLILKSMSSSIMCVANNLKMDRYGSIHSIHVYDSSWNLTDYVRDLKAALKSWRKVYWTLWADCHYLFCQVCEEYFPVGRMSWCRFHVETVQYFPVESQRTVFHSLGRYPCCGERVYRFEVIKKISGCQFRDHFVSPKNANETEIIKLWKLYKDIIKNDPPLEAEKKNFLKTVTDEETFKKSPATDFFWWEGLEIVPTKQSFGFLNKIWDAVIKKDEAKNVAASNMENKNQKPKTIAAHHSSIQEMSSLSDSSDESISSSNAGNSEESCHGSKITKSKSSPFYNVYCTSNRLSYIKKEKKRKKKKKKKNLATKNDGNRFWLSKLSTRCNQDNQREFEERALKQIEFILAKKLSGESFLERRTVGNRNFCQAVPSGGIYVKLEQEWRETHCFSHGCPGSSIKARGSASHININNSSFPVHKRSKSKGHR